MMMKRNAKLAVFTSFGLFCCAYIIHLPGGQVDAASNRISFAGPAQIYAASCARCHGADGRAKTAKGKRVGATDFTSGDWNTDEARGIRIITNGKSEMPAFKGKLTPNEIKAVFNYVLRFRR
jgi:mono/diheme cytochrome c family protein